MELKDMLMRRKIDPIYDPNHMRQSQDANTIPLVQKKFKSKERIGLEGPVSAGISSQGSHGVTYGLGLSSGRFKNHHNM
jgi:hypothetical protein